LEKHLPTFTQSDSYIVIVAFVESGEAYMYSGGQSLAELSELMEDAESEEEVLKMMPKLLLSGKTQIAFDQFVDEVL
jgi:hypothetical protein